MQNHVFFGITTVEWEAIAAVGAAIVSLINAVIVAFVAKFTFEYMRSTKELVNAAKVQSEASIRQADASIKTLELMNTERRQTDSFQRAVFTYSLENVVSALGRYVSVISSPAKPWHEGDCLLLPPEWDTCRAFVSRNASGLLDEMQEIETKLSAASCAIQGFIRTPDSMWLSTVQKRQQTGLQLASLQNRLNVFSRDALKSTTC